MKKNGMKKVWVPVIALCSAGLLVGTGFAAWTITLNQNGKTTGNRKADTVEDKHIKVTNIKWYRGVLTGETTKFNEDNYLGKDTEPTVVFGWADKTEGLKGSWLQNTNSGTSTNEFKEDRAFTLYFEVEKGEQANTVSPKVTFTLNDTDPAVYSPCVDQKLIVSPTVASDPSTIGSGYYVNVEWKWGTAFGGVNPINFYNRKAEGEINPSDAVKNLNLLSQLNNTTTEENNKGKPNFTVTIDVSGQNI